MPCVSFSQITNQPPPTENKYYLETGQKVESEITFRKNDDPSEITWQLETDLENYDSLKIPPTQVFNIYVGLKQNENLKKEVGRLKQIAVDLNNTIQEQNTEHQTVLDEVTELNSQVDDKNKELAKKEGEIEKLKAKAKRFSIGPSAGLGIDGKLYGGIGINYAVFRF